MTTITALPTPPAREDPTNFAVRADDFLAALPTFATETNAVASETNTAKTNAETAATTATTQAGLATTARIAAELAETNAETAATAAQLAETNAEAAQAAAELALDQFTDLYLGPKAANPTLDNDGNALLVGALYFNTVAGEMRVWSGTVWVQASFVPTVAASVANTPAGNIAATTVQAAINELDTEKVAKSGDTMTGNLTVPSLNGGQLAGLRNKIINGNFDVWQRGTSFANPNGYTADRWKLDSGTNITISRVPRAVGDGGTYRLRIAATNAVNGYTLLQAFEADVVNSLKGKTVTFSFYIDGSFTGAVLVGIQKSATADTSSTGFSTITSGNVTPTGSPVRHSFTATIPDDGTANGLRVFFTNSMTNGTAYDLQGVQLEVGSVATPFEHRPYGMELALCQRYYYRTVNAGGIGVIAYGGGVPASTTARAFMKLPVAMRIAPSAIEVTGTASDYAWAIGGSGFNGVPTYSNITSNQVVALDYTGTGLTIGQFAHLRQAATAGFVGVSAEL